MRSILDYRSPAILILALFVLAFVFSSGAFAQPAGTPGKPFSIQFNIANQELLKTDFKDDPGELASAHREFSLGLVVPQPQKRARWIFTGTREYNTYRIGGVENIDGDLQETYRSDLRGLYFHTLDSQWSVNAGFGLRWHAEQGASLEDAFMYDGMVGASYRLNENLRLGLTFLYFTRLDESALFIPAPAIDWTITERLALRTGRDVGFHYTLDERRAWTASWVTGYYTRSIRLNDHGLAANGASRDTYVASQWALRYSPHPGFFAKLEAGWIPWRTLRLADENKNTLFRGKLEPAPVISLQAGFAF